MLVDMISSFLDQSDEKLNSKNQEWLNIGYNLFLVLNS